MGWLFLAFKTEKARHITASYLRAYHLSKKNGSSKSESWEAKWWVLACLSYSPVNDRAVGQKMWAVKIVGTVANPFWLFQKGSCELCWLHAVFLLDRVNLAVVSCAPVRNLPFELPQNYRCIENKVDNILPFLRTMRPALKACILLWPSKKNLSRSSLRSPLVPSYLQSFSTVLNFQKTVSMEYAAISYF